jgi:chorismate mutase
MDRRFGVVEMMPTETAPIRLFDSPLAALAAQVDQYRLLLKLSELQREHIERGEDEALLDVLERRQRIVNQIGELEMITGPVRKQWEPFVMGLSPADRHRAELLLSEAGLLLGRITAADCDDALVLQQRKLNVGHQIRQTGEANQANRRYSAAYGPRQSMLDVRQ